MTGRKFAYAVFFLAAGMAASPAIASDDGLASPATVATRLPQFAAKVIGAPFSHRSPAFTASGDFIDLDGDKRPEIVQPFANYPPNGPNRAEPIKILKANPTTFAYSDATSSFITGAVPSLVHPRVFAKGDFNNDGRLDIFLGGHGYDAQPFAGETDSLLLSNAQGSHLTYKAPPGTKTFTHAIASGDINGDGIDDIYVGVLCCSADPGPYFLLGRNNAIPVVANDRLPPVVAQRTLKYTAAALVDVDGRKGKDLVLGSDGGHDSVVYLNNGAGSFNKAAPDIVLPPGLFGRNNTITLDILAVDLNSDGHPDLVLSQTMFNPFYQGYGLQVLMNRHGSFADETSNRLLNGSGFNQNGAWKSRIFAADFFGDGLVDLVVHGGCPTTSDTFVVWLNDGSGKFTPYKRMLFDADDTRSDCNFLYPIDVNLDGRSDLVRIAGVNQTTDQAWTYINLGPKGTGAASAPQIVRKPAALTVKAGAPLLLSVSARGQRPLRFQWFKDGKRVAGATRPVYRVAHAAASNAGKYEVHITNAIGSATSSSVTVTVN